MGTLYHELLGKHVTTTVPEDDKLWRVTSAEMQQDPFVHSEPYFVFVLCDDAKPVPAMRYAKEDEIALYVPPVAAVPITPLAGQSVEFGYLNHRGETATRQCVVIGPDYGSNEWYPEPQFFLRCIDTERNVIRSFALANIVAGTFKVLK